MTVFAGIPNIIAVAGHTVTLERCTTGVNSIGGRDRVWNTVTAGIAAWVQPAKPGVIAQYSERDVEVTQSVFFSTDPGAELGDRFLFGTRYLLVKGPKNAAEVDKLWRVDCGETE